LKDKSLYRIKKSKNHLNFKRGIGMAEFFETTDNGTLTLRITGNTGINSAKTIYDGMKKIIKKIKTKCLIDIKGIESPDISFAQTLLSFRKKLMTEGKDMEIIVGDGFNPFLSIMEKAGIDAKYFNIKVDK
jgi:hypothetical protein